MKTMTKIYFVAVAAFHFLLTVGVLALSFTRHLSRFDVSNSGVPEVSAIEMISRILLFPISLVLPFVNPTLLGGFINYFIFAVNSLIWAAAIGGLMSFFNREKRPT